MTEIINRSGGTKLKDYAGDLTVENFDLIAKVVFLLTYYNLWSDEGTYTFPDGETWGKMEAESSE